MANIQRSYDTTGMTVRQACALRARQCRAYAREFSYHPDTAATFRRYAKEWIADAKAFPKEIPLRW